MFTAYVEAFTELCSVRHYHVYVILPIAVRFVVVVIFIVLDLKYVKSPDGINASLKGPLYMFLPFIGVVGYKKSPCPVYESAKHTLFGSKVVVAVPV